ncbi:MAG: hypothetical protein ABI687_02045 [Flavitalea sp.]
MLLTTLLAGVFPAYAQLTPKTMTGEYYLTGVMETASGFLLQPDSTFKFYYTYGALDRFGEGKWSLKENNKLELNSRPRPEKDFALITAKKIPGDFITIRIVDNNSMLLRYIDCAVGNAARSQKAISTNDEGIALFRKDDAATIGLLFRLCPDRAATFKIEDPSLNYFEFRFEPWITEVFFDKFQLDIQEEQLIGKHPLLMGEKYTYLKQ